MSPHDANPTSSSWPQVRAGILAFVVLVHGIRVAPLPHKVHPHELEDPVAKEEVGRWSERLGSLGYTIGPEELGERVVQVTDGISSVHKGLTKPFRPFLKWTGTNQGWALFANPDTHPNRLRIDGITADGERRVLFLNGDLEHTWLRMQLKHRRIRPIFDSASARRKPNGPYKRLANWVWRQAQRDHPDLKAIELVLLETHSVLPGSDKKKRKPRVRHKTRVPR